MLLHDKHESRQKLSSKASRSSSTTTLQLQQPPEALVSGWSVCRCRRSNCCEPEKDVSYAEAVIQTETGDHASSDCGMISSLSH